MAAHGASAATAGPAPGAQGSAVENGSADSMTAILSRISELEPRKGSKGIIIEPKAEAAMKKWVAKEMKKVETALSALSQEEALQTTKHRLSELMLKLKREESLLGQSTTALADLGRKNAVAIDELGKVRVAKGKLEALCRELQRQNKLVQEESRRSREAELKKREGLSTQFQGTIDDITQRLDQDSAEKSKKAFEHDELRAHLTQFMAQNDVRAKHFEKLLESKDLEGQLANAKLAQQQQIAEHEGHRAEVFKAEAAKLKLSESNLREQLAMYAGKFDQFQDALTKSNAVFAKHSKDTEQLTGTVVQLTKDKNTWHGRYNKVNGALIRSSEDLTAKDTEIAAARSKIDMLEKLCRALQARKAAADAATTTSTATASTAPAINGHADAGAHAAAPTPADADGPGGAAGGGSGSAAAAEAGCGHDAGDDAPAAASS